MVFESSSVINTHNISPNLRAFFVGYDLGEYRNEPFVDVLMDTIVDFAFGYHTGILKQYDRRRLVEAAKSIYRIKAYSEVKWIYVDDDKELSDCELQAKDKYLKRGEFGEMILHLFLRDYFYTVPLLAKVHFKDTDNATVHGFDVVHIGPDLLDSKSDSLYLGESKLYSRKDGNSGQHGVADLIEDIQHHFKSDFLFRELALIGKKKDAFPSIDDYSDQNTRAQYAEFLEKKKYWYGLLGKVEAKKVKLQDFLKSVTIPLVCTYQSKIFDGCCDENDDAFKAKLDSEVQKLYQYFKKKLENIQLESGQPKRNDLNIVLILFPILSKKALIRSLHDKLYKQQG